MEHQLDKEKIQAISSETRTKILKALQERRKTLSELAAEIGLAHSTLSEHLERLVKAGLIKKAEEGHKWKYYELTMLGKSLGSPDIKWYVLFGFFSVFIISGFLWSFSYYANTPMYFKASLEAAVQGGAAVPGAPAAAENYFVKPQFPNLAIVMIVFGIVGFLISKFSYEKEKSKRIKKHKSK